MIAKVLYELLIGGFIVIGRLKHDQPVKLLLCPLANFWSFYIG